MGEGGRRGIQFSYRLHRVKTTARHWWLRWPPGAGGYERWPGRVGHVVVYGRQALEDHSPRPHPRRRQGPLCDLLFPSGSATCPLSLPSDAVADWLSRFLPYGPVCRALARQEVMPHQRAERQSLQGPVQVSNPSPCSSRILT